jgi:hypothetical protein
VSREATRTRVRLRGELDIATVRLVVDAAEDSRRDGWAFAVTHGSWPVRRVLELLELDKHLPYDRRTG